MIVDTDSFRFHAGDKVKRRENVFDNDSPMLHGVVTRVYSIHESYYPGFPDIPTHAEPELYEVTWYESGRSTGYLPHGLEHD